MWKWILAGVAAASAYYIYKHREPNDVIPSIPEELPK